MNPKTGQRGAQILIVEDSATQREELQHLLEERGHAVASAANGREALESARRRKPTVIISDIVMPELDGYGLCQALKSDEALKDIPIVLLTMLSDASDVILGLECGADNFIRKPYQADYLLQRIEYLLMNLELRRNQKTRMGIEISLGGQRYFITAERQQILDLLISTYEQATHINKELAAREKELAHSNEVLNGLNRIAEGLNGASSEREVAETALEHALALPGIQAGWISLREGESGFRLAAARNLPPALEAPGAMEGDCSCRRRLLSGELDSAANILECERLARIAGGTPGLCYHAAVPLWIGDRTLGVMNLASPQEGFAEEELEMLYGVGNQVAVALERARLHQHMERLVEQRTAALEAEVAERKRIEQDQARLVAIIEATPDFVATGDPEGRVFYVNQAGLRMIGYEPGQDVSELPLGTGHPDWALKLVLETGIPHAIEHGTWSGETAFVTRSGREIPISQVIIAHKGPSGSVEYLSTIARDITELKRAEEALREEHASLLKSQQELFDAHELLAEADRLETVGRLAAGVAHEVKNPLGIIRLGTDHLAQHFSQGSSQEVVDDIRAAIDRAERVIRDLLNFSRQNPFALRPTDIDEVIDNAINLTRHEIQHRNIAIIRNRDDPIPPISADPNRLVQVFINLLSNAAQAIVRDGRIEIVTRSICLSERDLERSRMSVFSIGEPVVTVDIRDNGPGISAEHEKKLFEPFFTTKPVGEGSGLGLAVSRGIVMKHRGSISVSNRPEGGASALLMFRVDREHLANEKANTGSR